MMVKPKKSLRQSLIIFVRSPKLGKVKTRLAKEVGDKEALSIYIRLLRHTREVAEGVNATRHLFYSDEVIEDEWSTDYFQKVLQAKGDLGDKMHHAMGTALETSSKAIIIGSDCAQLSSSLIESAYEALDQNDVVIGPTFDGGYYLLGVKKVHKELFEDMTWSVESVFDETVRRIELKGLSYSILDKLSDIDYKEDWDKYGLDA